MFCIGVLECCVLYILGYILVCMIYLVGDSVFVGDILFMFDYGIVCCDFFGGDVC